MTGWEDRNNTGKRVLAGEGGSRRLEEAVKLELRRSRD